MNINARKLFTLSTSDSEYFSDSQDKIELVSCAGQGMKCKNQLIEINIIYSESHSHLKEKDYQRAIEKLKSAYHKTTVLTDNECIKCSELFRSTIIESLKNIKEELRTLTTGFLGSNHYRSSYILAYNVLEEIKKATV